MKMLYPLCLLLMIFSHTVAAQQPEPPTNLIADDGAQIEVNGAISLAIIGNTRSAVSAVDIPAGRNAPNKGVTEALMADIGALKPGVVVLLGDHVRKGTPGEYKKLLKKYGSTLSTIPVAPLPGDHEFLRDDRLENWARTFPEVGADIGFNRFASWYAFDIVSRDVKYRMIFLDSGKNRLGSRWREQLAWLEETALRGRIDNLIIFMHDPLISLSGREPTMNPNGAPLELIEVIEQYVDPDKIRAIVSAGGHANQVIRPDGPLGTLYLNAGGGGAPGEDLTRWADAEQAKRTDEVHLEARYDVALLKALDRWSETKPVAQNLLDEATASGTFKGFTGVIDSKALTTYGWFQVTLLGSNIIVNFRHWMPDGTIEDRYAIRYIPVQGWEPMSK